MNKTFHRRFWMSSIIILKFKFAIQTLYINLFVSLPSAGSGNSREKKQKKNISFQRGFITLVMFLDIIEKQERRDINHLPLFSYYTLGTNYTPWSIRKHKSKGAVGESLRIKTAWLGRQFRINQVLEDNRESENVDLRLLLINSHSIINCRNISATQSTSIWYLSSASKRLSMKLQKKSIHQIESLMGNRRLRSR